MKIAYIILAHKYPEQLIRLIRRLNTEKTSFFVHIDKNTNDEIYRQMFKNLSKFSNVYFLNRSKSSWGSFNIVKATLEGIKEIFNSQVNFDYVMLLSGQDYPIKSNNQIDKFLSENRGKEFIEYFPLPFDGWKPGDFSINVDRVECWFIKGWLVRSDGIAARDAKFSFKMRFFLELCSFLILLNVLPRKRKFPKGFKPFGGSQFWCLSKACAEYINKFVETNHAFVNFFKFSGIPDETFFQTIILNSHFKDRVIKDDLKYVVWPGPAILRKSDFEKIINSSDLFARKFDTTIDAEVLDMLDQKIQLGEKYRPLETFIGD